MQEVAGSSPASSIRRTPAHVGVFHLWSERRTRIVAILDDRPSCEVVRRRTRGASRRRVARDVRMDVEAGVMPAGAQGDPGSGAPAAGRLVAVLRRKPLTARRAAVIIAGFTVLVTFAGGLVAWLTDRKDFDSLGAGLWWSLQTITTVGYGDVVPSSGTGRVIGAFVMISGRIPHGDHCRSDRGAHRSRPAPPAARSRSRAAVGLHAGGDLTAERDRGTARRAGTASRQVICGAQTPRATSR